MGVAEEWVRPGVEGKMGGARGEGEERETEEEAG